MSTDGMDRPRRVLMVAYHFPPLAGSSGIQRTLRFAQQLPRFGWQPLVLSASPCAYERTSTDLDADIPPGTVVRRALALDTARHLAWRGRYVAAMARPDRWVSWRLDGVRQGMKLVRQYKPDALWSTYPIATAHVIGAELHRRTGLPWIADFRDPMAQEGYPADPLTWRQYSNIERLAVTQAAASIFTTPGAARVYRQRYPASHARIHVLENGYDEESFASVASGRARAPLNPGAVTLLHSGIVYPQERDPTHLMKALQLLSRGGVIHPERLKIRFRAAVRDDLLRSLASAHGVLDFLQLMPPVSYREALNEMLDADGLLVLQAGDCNEQIPAKLYEYLRAQRPIVCVSDPAGDTAGLVRAAGLDTIARIDDANDIAALLRRFAASPAAAALPDAAFVRNASRLARSEALADLLHSCV